MAAIMYKNVFLYNLIMCILHKGYSDYRVIANMVEGRKILDLGCGSCKILDYLPKNINYEGWDLNEQFLDHSIKKCINVKKINVYDIKKTNKKWDTIIIKDFLHHVYPRDTELLVILKNKAKYIVVCEPLLEKKRLKDVIFDHKLFDYIHYYFGDFDSINSVYAPRQFQRNYDKNSFLLMLGSVGSIVEHKQNKEMVFVKVKL